MNPKIQSPTGHKRNNELACTYLQKASSRKREQLNVAQVFKFITRIDVIHKHTHSSEENAGRCTLNDTFFLLFIIIRFDVH